MATDFKFFSQQKRSEESTSQKASDVVDLLARDIDNAAVTIDKISNTAAGIRNSLESKPNTAQEYKDNYGLLIEKLNEASQQLNVLHSEMEGLSMEDMVTTAGIKTA